MGDRMARRNLTQAAQIRGVPKAVVAAQGRRRSGLLQHYTRLLTRAEAAS
jgi:hypothetical protein